MVFVLARRSRRVVSEELVGSYRVESSGAVW